MSHDSRFARARPVAARTPLALVAAVVALCAAATVALFGSAAASAGTGTAAAVYYGTWNYDQPDAATLNNVAVLACADGGTSCSHNPQMPLPLSIPQVGWIDFSPGPNGTLYGHTDQGCIWNFAVTPGGLELSSTTQLCFNTTIGQYYSIKQWSVQVSGNAEYEQIISQSIQPNGDILYTRMNFRTKDRPSRHKVSGDRADAAVNRFVGSFTYDPFSFQTLDNITVTDKGAALPESGLIRIDRAGGTRIVAHTSEGCSWTFAVHGNTAELLESGRIRAAFEQQAPASLAAGERAQSLPEAQPISSVIPRHAPAATAHKPPRHDQAAQPDVGPDAAGDDGNRPQPSIPLIPSPPHRDGTSPADTNIDLAALLPAARAAREDLLRQGRSLSRDSLVSPARSMGPP